MLRFGAEFPGKLDIENGDDVVGMVVCWQGSLGHDGWCYVFRVVGLWARWVG